MFGVWVVGYVLGLWVPGYGSQVVCPGVDGVGYGWPTVRCGLVGFSLLRAVRRCVCRGRQGVRVVTVIWLGRGVLAANFFCRGECCAGWREYYQRTILCFAVCRSLRFRLRCVW